jgi:WD40 repeat protein
MSQPQRLPFFALIGICAALAAPAAAAPPQEGAWAEQAVLKSEGNVMALLAFAPDGKTLAVAGGGFDPQTKKQAPYQVTLWNTDKKEVRQTLKGIDKWLVGLSFTADGEKLVSAGADGVLRRWDPAAGKELDNTPVADEIKYFWPTADRKSVLVSAIWRGSPRPRPDTVEYQLRELATGKKTDTITPAANHQPLALAPDGKSLAVNAHRPPDPKTKLPPGASVPLGRSELCLWEVGAARESAPLTALFVSRAAFAPQGKLLAFEGYNATTMRRAIFFYDLAAKKMRGESIPYKNNIEALAFSDDGKRFAYAAEDHVIRIWDTGNFKEVAALKGHRGPINTLAFAPDGQVLASASSDTTLRLWSPKRAASPGER